MKLLRAIFARIAIGFIAYDRKVGDLVSLRRRLDRFLEEYAEDYPLMLAFDGARLFAEGRNDEGKKRLAQCLEILPADGSDDARYISLFCRFNLNLSNERIRISARKEASRLRVDSWVRWFLPLVTEERLLEIEHEERSRAKTVNSKQNETPVSFDF